MIVTCPDCRRDRAIKSGRPGVHCHRCARRHQDVDASMARVHAAYRAQQAEVDEIAVQRIVRGDRPTVTTRAEREAAVVILTRRGWSASQIAMHAGITVRTVSRLRVRAGIAQPWSGAKAAAA